MNIDDAIIQNIDCFGSANGSIQLLMSGGTTPYTFNWEKTVGGDVDSSFSGNTALIQNLSPGDYKVTVTDANDCSILSSTYTISQPDELKISIDPTTKISCFGEGGIIKVNIDGESVRNYKFVLNGTDYLNQNVNIGVEDVDNNSTTFSDVLAGTYSVVVTDANGCQKTIENIVLEQPEILEISSETVTDITCNGSDDGSIDIAVSGGTGNYTYSWSNNATTQDITDLSPGTYTVNITDQNGCLVSKEYTILEPDALSISADVSNFNGFEISCNGASDGAIDITVSGGTTDYTFAWTKDNQSYSTNEDISNLSPGEYKVVVTDANDCQITSQAFKIEEPNELLIENSALTAVDCYDGTTSIQVNITLSLLTHT